MLADLRPARYRVVEHTAESPDITTVRLAPIDEPIPRPRPGQFTMLYAFGAGEVPISMSGIPRDSDELVHTIHQVGATTRRLGSARPGTTVGVRGPFGAPWALDAAAGGDVVVVAGGVGLAPLRPVVHELIARRGEFAAVSVLVGARRPSEAPFREEVRTWSTYGIDVGRIVDVPEPGWSGEVGVVTALVDTVAMDPARTTAFVCGPEVMMRFTARALVDRGVPAERVHVSLERNMQCAVRRCGQCQLGPWFLCAEGPRVDWARAEPVLAVRRW